MLETGTVLGVLKRFAPAAAGGLALYDVAGGRLIPLGEGLTALLGHSAGEVERLGIRALRDLVHEGDQARLDELIERVAGLADGDACGAALRMRQADGRWRVLQFNAVVFARDARGQPAAVLISLRAVRATGQAMDGASASLLSVLLEYVPESLTLTGGPPEFAVLAQTRRARELFGSPARIADFAAVVNGRADGLYLADGRAAPGPEDLPACRATRFGEAIAGEEWLLRRADGHSIALDVDAIPVANDGIVAGAICVWREAGERKRLEDALRERSEQLALVLRSTRLGWWSYEIASGRSVWSEECRQLWGWPSPAGPSRADMLARVMDADRARVRRALERTEQETEPLEIEFRVRLPDGGARWVRVSADCHCDDEGAPLRIFGAMADITAAKRAEAALHESEERFRQLAEAVGEIFWVLDPSRRRWLYLSPAYMRIFDGQAEPGPDDWLRAVDAADREAVAHLFAGEVEGCGFELEYRLHTPGGLRWMRDRGLVSRDEDGRVLRMLGVSEDITERKLDRLTRRRRRARATRAGRVDLAEVVGVALERLHALAERRGQRIELEGAGRPLPLRGNPRPLVRIVILLLEMATRRTAPGEALRVRMRATGKLAAIEVGGMLHDGTPGPGREVPDGAACGRPAVDGDPGDGLAEVLEVVREQAEELGGSVGALQDGGARATLVLRLPLAEAAGGSDRRSRRLGGRRQYEAVEAAK